MIKRALAASAAVLALAACASSSSDDGGDGGGVSFTGGNGDTSTGSASVNGTIASTSIAAASAIAVTGVIATDSQTNVEGDASTTTVTNLSGVSIVISDKANSCRALHDASTKLLSLSVYANAPGTYAIENEAMTAPTQGKAAADFTVTDAACNDTLGYQSSGSGSITITALSSSSVTGSFDITMVTNGGATSGHVTGTFDAPICGTILADAGSPLAAADGGLLCAP